MYRTILAAADDSQCAKRALRAAIDLARTCHAKLVVCHVIDYGYLKYEQGYAGLADLRPELLKAGSALLTEAENQICEAGVPCETRLVDEMSNLGDIAGAVCLLAQEYDADLIVMGTHGRHGMQRLLMGSVAQGVIRHAQVPVLLVTCREEADAAGVVRAG